MLRLMRTAERNRRGKFPTTEVMWPAEDFAGHSFLCVRLESFRNEESGGVGTVVVVLVRARNPNNIGAVARAMHDFGFRHLRVVNEYAVPFEAARSAVDAWAVLGEANAYGSVAEAVADCTLVVGTTAVGERDLQHPLHVLADAGGLIRRELARGGWAGCAAVWVGEDWVE